MNEEDMSLLRDAGERYAYCGYDKKVRASAARLEQAGLGMVGENDCGPIFRINESGIKAAR